MSSIEASMMGSSWRLKSPFTTSLTPPSSRTCRKPPRYLLYGWQRLHASRRTLTPPPSQLIHSHEPALCNWRAQATHHLTQGVVSSKIFENFDDAPRQDGFIRRLRLR